MTEDDEFEFDIRTEEIPQSVAYLALFPRSEKRQSEAVRVWLVERYMQMFGKLPDSRALNGIIADCHKYVREGPWIRDADK